MNTTILVVDDEQRMRTLIKDFLVKKDYEVIEAKDGEEALEIFEEKQDKIDLILLDVMMPKLDGWSVLRQIRQTKPFSPKILVARVEAILKRTSSKVNKTVEYGGIEIDEDGRSVKVDGKNIDMSLREYELLKYLVDNIGIALSRDKILNNVWNYDYYGDSRTIDSHIKKIRHKLGKRGKYIKTMRGIGYKFEIK